MATLAAEAVANTTTLRLVDPTLPEITDAPMLPQVITSANTPQTEVTHFAFSISESILPPPSSLLRLREAACYAAFYLAGYKDVHTGALLCRTSKFDIYPDSAGVTGTLLPSIESTYNVDYSTVAELFVAYCVGYLISAFGTGEVMRRCVSPRFHTNASERISPISTVDGVLDVSSLGAVSS